MKKVFSFSLFGSKKMYWKGLYANIVSIQTQFPDWWTYIWVDTTVPEEVLLYLSTQPNVKLIPTNETGLINMSYRFFSIDDPEVEVMCVRDADSRIYERDIACIHDFVGSEKLFHIIRDHPNHHHTIMGGMWGIKKDLLTGSIQTQFELWRKSNTASEFWNDMDFLRSLFYPHVLPYTMIHDELQTFEPTEWKTPFRVPLEENKMNFIGQIYVFDEHDREYPGLQYKQG